jgi:hypothetical protein
MVPVYPPSGDLSGEPTAMNGAEQRARPGGNARLTNQVGTRLQGWERPSRMANRANCTRSWMSSFSIT